MFERVDYVVSDIPPLNSEFMRAYTKHWYEQFCYFDEARQQLTTEIWPACDSAYLCQWEPPELEAGDWVDSSTQGESDIKDGVDFLSDAICLALYPRDESAFTLVPENPEDQAHANQVRDLLAALCRKADLRGQYSKHLKQVLIRGTSAMWVSWKKAHKMVKLGRPETLRRLKELGQAAGIDDMSFLDKVRFPQVAYNAPVVQPIDMYNLLLDPNSDLSTEHDITYIVRTYKTPEDLKYAVDEYGQPLYDQNQLKDVEPWTIEEIRNQNYHNYDTLELLGINPLASGRTNAKYIPVLCCYKFSSSFAAEGDESNRKQFVDTYTYVALGKSVDKTRIIRVQENPANYGGKCVFIDTYTDWISGTAYGIGAVEKSLSAYTQKNVISKLTMNAQVASVFPAMSVIGDVLGNERKLKLGPSAINVIKWKPSVGLNYIAPLPAPQGGVQLGMMDQQFLGQKILGQLGAYGAVLQDPTKTVTRSKTATQINTESSSGSITRDNFLEKVTIRTLEPMLQHILESAMQHLDDKVIKFESSIDGQVSQGSLPREELQKPWKVVVTGFHGQINKAQEIQELQQALGVLLQGKILEFLPTLGPAVQDTVFRLLGRLGVRNLEHYRGSPIEVLMQFPQIQQLLQQMQMEAAQQGYTEGQQVAASEFGPVAPPPVPVAPPGGAYETGPPGI